MIINCSDLTLGFVLVEYYIKINERKYIFAVKRLMRRQSHYDFIQFVLLLLLIRTVYLDVSDQVRIVIRGQDR